MSINIDATVKLVSTDDQTFTFHLYHLLSARQVSRLVPYANLTRSAVFRDLLPSGQVSLEIRFTDPSIEDGTTLNLFHQHVYDVRVPSAHTVRLVDLDRLMGFLHKYDCQPLLRSILLDLKSYLPQSRSSPDAEHTASPVEVFTIAASYGSVSACAEVLAACQRGQERQWAWLDPRNMPVEAYERLPAKFAWALLRSMHRQRAMNDPEMWMKASKVFVETMETAEGEQDGGRCQQTAAERVKARSDRKAKLSSCPYTR